MESIIELFSRLVNPLARRKSGHGHDPFWERGNEQVMRNVSSCSNSPGSAFRFASIDRVIKSLPTHPERAKTPRGNRDSYCAQTHRIHQGAAGQSPSQTNGAIWTSRRSKYS